MKRIQYFLLLPLLALVITGCEKVVEIDLNDTDPQLVIEAVVRNAPGDNYVLISRSASIYEDAELEQISGATVSITDPLGVNHLLTEVEPGRYNGASISGEVGNYALSVEVEGETVTATTVMQPTVVLDSIVVEEAGGFGGNNAFQLFVGFQDPVGTPNFYRFKVFKNGEAQDGWSQLDDDIFDGNEITFPLFQYSFEAGDTGRVELMNIPEENYRYLETLANAQGNSAFDAAPGNPISNHNGNAIGFFTAWAVSELPVAIPE